MFETDDYDQVLSQLDLPESFENIEQGRNTNTFSFNVNDQETCTTDKSLDIIEKENNKATKYSDKVENTSLNTTVASSMVSPKHTKRKLINSHFNHPNKRKFPGPAGLLTGCIEETNDNSLCQMELYSQDLDSSLNHPQHVIFETPLWKRLLQDTKDLHNVNTIKIVKQNALAGNLRRKKAEIVCGYIDCIDRSAIDPLITLRDTTGQIKCTLHRDAWTHFASYISSEYCVMILQNPTVLTTGSAFKKHYLNVTTSNIYVIYSSTILDENEDLPESFVKVSHDDFTIIKCEKKLDFDCTNKTEAVIDELEGLDFSELF